MRDTLCQCEHRRVTFDLVYWPRESFLQKRTIDFRSGGGKRVNQMARRGKRWSSYKWKTIGKDQRQDES